VPQLIWTPAAARDVSQLYRFLASKNRDAARRAVQTIRRGVNPLTAHPEIGRPVEDLGAEFRGWPIPFGDSAYVVLYRFDGRTVVVLAVRHGREAGY
jgi:plasmid stabilization system protein ParE